MRMGFRTGSMTAVSLLALFSAVPAFAEDVTVTDITAGEGYALTVPSVTATATNLTEAQIRRIFTGDFATSASSLADLDAGEISIPEITVSYEVPSGTGEGVVATTATYRDIVISDVVDGVAGSAVVGATDISSEGITMSLGAMSTGTFDIGALLAMYGLGTPSAGEAFKTVYADFEFAGGTFEGPGFACDIGGAALEEFKARPLKTNFADFIKVMAEVDESSTPSPAVLRAIVDFYADLLTAFESTPMTADGLSCSGSDGKGSDVAFSSGTLEMGGYAPGIYPSIALNGLVIDVTGKEAGNVQLGNFTWKPMDFTGPLEALKSAPAELTEQWFADNWRKLIPAIGGLSLEDLSVDAPDMENAGSRIQASLGVFDLALADYVNGIPSDIGVTTTNLVITVPDDAEGKMLRAMGISTLNLSQNIQLHWDEANQNIVVESIAFDAENLGTIEVSGIIGNATPDLFSADNNLALVASMGLTVKELTFNIDDRGGSALIMAAAAAAEGQDPNVLRVGMAGLAQAMVLGLVGTTPDAMAASEEVAAFIKSKPQVTITLTATDEKGIALPLLMAASENPAALAGQIAIKATASGDARPTDQPLAAPAATDDAPAAESGDGTAATPNDGTESDAQVNKKTLKN
jgi:hypothetical protein